MKKNIYIYSSIRIEFSWVSEKALSYHEETLWFVSNIRVTVLLSKTYLENLFASSCVRVCLCVVRVCVCLCVLCLEYVYLTFTKSIWFIKLWGKLHAYEWMYKMKCTEWMCVCVCLSIKLDVYREMLRRCFGFLVFAVLEHRDREGHREGTRSVSCTWKIWGEKGERMESQETCSNTNKLLISNKVLQKLNKKTHTYIQ